MVSHLAWSDGGSLIQSGCEDLRSLAETVKFTRRMAQQEPFKSILGMSWACSAMSLYTDSSSLIL